MHIIVLDAEDIATVAFSLFFCGGHSAMVHTSRFIITKLVTLSLTAFAAPIGGTGRLCIYVFTIVDDCRNN